MDLSPERFGSAYAGPEFTIFDVNYHIITYPCSGLFQDVLINHSGFISAINKSGNSCVHIFDMSNHLVIGRKFNGKSTSGSGGKFFAQIVGIVQDAFKFGFGNKVPLGHKHINSQC